MTAEVKNIHDFIAELTDYIESNCDYVSHTNGTDAYHITAESYASDSDIAYVLNKGIDAFYDYVNDIEFDYMLNYLSEFIENYSQNSNVDELHDIASDYISEHVIFRLDIDSTPLETFTLIDTGDANYEYDIPSCYLTTESLISDFSSDKHFLTSGITWLIKSQGYDPIQFVKDIHSEGGYKGDSKFLKSLASELNDCYASNTYAVCIPSLMTTEDYINITNQQEAEVDLSEHFAPLSYKGSSYLVFSKGTTLGLFDAINGGGSNFDIVLEKDIKIPLPCADVFLDYGNRSKWAYTVGSVYGGSMSDDCHGLSHYHLMPHSDIKFTLNR